MKGASIIAQLRKCFTQMVVYFKDLRFDEENDVKTFRPWFEPPRTQLQTKHRDQYPKRMNLQDLHGKRTCVRILGSVTVDAESDESRNKS